MKYERGRNWHVLSVGRVRFCLWITKGKSGVLRDILRRARRWQAIWPVQDRSASIGMDKASTTLYTHYV